MAGRLCLLLTICSLATVVQADEFVFQRCEILPLADDQTSMRIQGVERLRWHFDQKYHRPFFYPFNGPSGVSLTRMGHPGAENHDHHRSVWFAYHNVNGVDFWADQSGSTVRQKHWYRYRDGETECVLAVRLGWYDSEGTELMDQDMIAALRPLPDGEHVLELQLVFRVPEGGTPVTLGQTSLGPLAVRVAKSVSAHFGGGQLHSSEGLTGEPEIFGTQARWMDYSGPLVVGAGEDRRVVREGITFFDHPRNLRYPTHWHVRSDGWMCAAFGMKAEHIVTPSSPLTLRYLLHAHAGDYSEQTAAEVHRRFSERTGFRVFRPGPDRPHLQYEVERVPQGSGG